MNSTGLMKIAVTGATGLVGYHVVRCLLELGHEVVAIVRPSSITAKLQTLELQERLHIGTCALNEERCLSQSMAGCEIVVHAAGAVDPLGNREYIYATNCDGTRHCLNAAVAAGVKQFIHVSSLSVITGQKDQRDVDEQSPVRYCGEAYADSKVDAEKIVEAYAGQIATTIVRPGFIYGPGEHAWLPRLIASLRSGKVMLVDGGNKQTNVIYVENLSRAISLTLLNPQAFGQTYNLTDGQTPSKKELFDTICDELGYDRVKRKIPGAVAWVVCEIVSVVAPLLGRGAREKLSRFSRAAYRLAAVNQGFSIAKAEAELGYTERVPFKEGMKATLVYFQDTGQVGTDSQCPLNTFLVDYCARHRHPVNAFCHVLGVPLVVFGIVELAFSRVLFGLGLIVGGYLLQYLGHRAQGNEVGEVTLIKHLYKRLLPRGGKTNV